MGEKKKRADVEKISETPGGFAMVATLPADIVQYYGYLLRATQKLLYLYMVSPKLTPQKRSINLIQQ